MSIIAVVPSPIVVVFDICSIVPIVCFSLRTMTNAGSALKTLKDLYGIWYAASQLGNFSQSAIDEFRALAKQHPKWFKTFQKNLQTWLSNASPGDWSKLEAQDPSGRLRKLNFEQTIYSLI